MLLLDYLFGPRYWANIIRTRGTANIEICSYIFTSPQAAEHHKAQLLKLRSYEYITTISFRSRNIPATSQHQ
ncbi:hypothetical protein [Paramuribaculum intestinale]|uniref:hypothetical protein n=1 Tax=Paramuribaculum intestinale TaxID=2094151 RepID=UPI0025AA2F8C|nr:hypothetical protein [Paramuribaculum intestinale]